MGKNKTLLRTDKFYTFDIETTSIITGTDARNNLMRDAIIYSGQFYDGTTYKQVRSLEDCIDTLKLIESRVAKGSKEKVCIYVHFLSYEFQFIKDFFRWEKILATSQRKIISAETRGLVFRCSYFLSNMSLKKFLEAENVPAEYQKSSMDFNVRRFPWTPLTDDELIYMRNDVVGLHIAIQGLIHQTPDDNINQLPLTNTGYVRTDCRKAVTKNKANRSRFTREAMPLNVYKLVHEAFRGGNTHANRNYVKKVCKGVASVDIASSYPFQILVHKYPTKFYKMAKFNQTEFNFYRQRDYALIIRVKLANVALKPRVPVPYLSLSKCHNCVGYKLDNGRVLSCESCEMVITEIDWDIIQSQYTFDYTICEVWYSVKKELPDELKKVVIDYYEKKTTLKGVDDYFYMKSKNRLNSCYGMMVTAILRESYAIDNLTHLVIATMDDEGTQLSKHYKSFSSFLSYQWGVWVTAYARQQLQNMIDIIGYDDFIYCDTDSCKFMHYDKHKADIDAYNKELEALAIEHGAYADMNGKRYCMGVFEYEGMSEKFKTWGAKKYMAGSDDNFKITISGVPKASGHDCIQADVNAGKLATPFDVDIGYTFRGIKSTMKYNDYQLPKYIDIEGHKVMVASNVAAYDANYQLGLSNDFELLLSAINGELE